MRNEKHNWDGNNDTLDKFLENLFNLKYGEGKWKKGAGTEYSETRKGLRRGRG